MSSVTVSRVLTFGRSCFLSISGAINCKEVPVAIDLKTQKHSSPDAHAGQTRHSSHVTPLCTPQAVTLPYSHESGTAERRSTARSGARLHEYESVYECRQEDGGGSRRGTVM